MAGKILSALIFCICGFLFISVGSYLAFFQTKGYHETTATVTSIEGVRTDIDHKQFDSTVVYTVHNVEYTGVIRTHSNTSSIGKEVKILYNPAHPEEIINDARPLGIFIGIVGLMVILCSPIMVKLWPGER